jgi:hypothetical protein
LCYFYFHIPFCNPVYVLTVPILSTGKATYALGLLPCVTVVCSEGAKPFLKTPILKSITAGIIAVWVVCSYCSFFVIEIVEPLPICAKVVANHNHGGVAVPTFCYEGPPVSFQIVQAVFFMRNGLFEYKLISM